MSVTHRYCCDICGKASDGGAMIRAKSTAFVGQELTLPTRLLLMFNVTAEWTPQSGFTSIDLCASCKRNLFSQLALAANENTA